MGEFRNKRYPVFAPIDDDDDDFRPRRRKKHGWIPWLSDTESDFVLRFMTVLIGGAATFFLFKLNERMSALELKFAVFEVRHEIKEAQIPSVIDDKPEVWATPELTIVPNFVRDYFGVRPLPPMNRRRKK